VPTTIIDSDLAHAPRPGGRVILHYTGRVHPPAYFLIQWDRDGREVEREGPFEDEDTAMAAAKARFGPLQWRAR